MRSLPRQARWTVPVAAVAAAGLVVAGSALVGARAVPRLPARSTAQLLAAAGAPAARLPAMTAVVQETASLGLPNLPGSSDAMSPLSLLSGTHTFSIWYDGPARVRIAMPVPLGETDLRRDGRDVWLWNSRTNQATHFVLPAAAAAPPEAPVPAANPPTPQQLARQILAAAGPTTTVGLQPDVMVAGQAAYQLSLAPKDGRSLIGQVRIAIDAEYGLPLRVQVFARGARAPAFQVGYTSISFGRPAASNFPFSAPPGAKVKTITVPNVAGAAGALPGRGCHGAPATSAVPVMTGGPRVIGHGWLSVLVLPAGFATFGLPGSGVVYHGSSGSEAYSSTLSVSNGPGGPAVDASGLTAALLGAARPVHGAWGSGRLLRTSLLSVLITSGGQVLIGAVQPAVLFADAAQLR